MSGAGLLSCLLFVSCAREVITSPPSPQVPFLDKGLVAGSWALQDPQDFEVDRLGEANLREVFTGQRLQRRTWRGFSSTEPILPLDTLFNDRAPPSMGYVYSLVQREKSDIGWPNTQAVLHVSHRGRARVWFEGELVIDAPSPPSGTWGTVRSVVQLTGAFDVLLIKVAQEHGEAEGSMNLQVRLSDIDGSPLPRTSWNTMRPGHLPRDN